jgi:hypothetical protein
VSLIECLGVEMVKLEQMGFSFIISHCQKLACVTEFHAEGIL